MDLKNISIVKAEKKARQTNGRIGRQTSRNMQPFLYEAWGEIKNGDVNSCKMLAKCSFKLLKDLGTSFYKDHGYCAYCVNKDKNCRACYCKIYILAPV